MIKLRPLKITDAQFMLEWMHDEDIQKGFRKNMLGMTKENAETFIGQAISDFSKVKDGGAVHYAISNELDEYLGTISLKNISIVNNNAEFAIVLRKEYQGKGYAKEATTQLIEKAFHEFGLHKIYLSVLENNLTAKKSYESSGFIYEGELKEHICINGKYETLKLYGIINQ